MIAALVLLGYAAALGTLGPRLLDRARWAAAAPRLAIATWFALAIAFLLAIVLAGAAIVVPLEVHSSAPGGFVWHCLQELCEHYGDLGGIALALGAVVLMLVVPARVIGAVVSVWWSTRTERSRLRRTLASARVNPELGAVVLDETRPAAYCLPGRGGLIVLTSGVLDLLHPAQVQAVIAHERAHLRGGHHRIVALAKATEHLFGPLPLFTLLPKRIAHLVELAADDDAARAAGGRVLARSLLSVAAAQTPAEALAAGGGDTVARIERLLQAPTAPGLAGVGSILGGNFAALAMPVLIVVVPIATAVGIACCQV